MLYAPSSAIDTLAVDLALIDRVAALMVAADNGDEVAGKQAGDLYRTNPALTFAGRSFVTSPALTPPFTWMELRNHRPVV